MRKFALAAAIFAGPASGQDEYDKAFQDFQKEFDKEYANDVERMERFEKFKATYDYVKAENAKGHKYKVGINPFADQSPDEFAKTHFGYKMPKKLWGSLESAGTHVYDGSPLADSIDWVSKGAVTPVKNQGQCGSCWSFSTTGALEGAWEIATGKLVSLSEEMLVDCSKANNGCGGGSMDLAFQYVEKSGLCTEKSYPYIAGGGKKGTCKASSCTVGLPAGAVTSFKDVASDSQQALMSALMKGPVSIAVEADKRVFQTYKTGVMNGMCGTNLDHGILAVGYGTESGTDYWKVKNSWGQVWGESGYGNLERGKGGAGECGLLKQASYPIVSGKPGPSPGPSPPAPPAPPAPPTPPSPGTSHYEKPPCQSDEVDAQIQGLDGSVCAPKCNTAACPSDTPAGTKDTPSCCLQDSSSGDKYCALECGIGGCPPGASCKHPSGSLLGICVYPSSGLSDKKTHVTFVPGITDEYEQAFQEFEKKFDKKYADDEERLQRFQNFKGTYDYIKSENAKDHKYKLGVLPFADESPEEFAKSHFGYKMPEKVWGSLQSSGTHVYDGAPLADSIDWVSKGAVTPVKNQGQCGSCWSFSTTGSLEGAWEIATGKLVSLSEEMLVDCSKANNGCGGGSMDLAFQYVEKSGLCTEKSYPYIAGGGKKGTCKASSCTLGLPAGAVTSFKDVASDSEQALMSAIMKGPVSIAVEADKRVFQTYKSGVMNGMCGTNLDHGILAVGYGTESGTNYWKVKNSWGQVWGESGYGNLERGKGGAGECGLLKQASYPVVSGKPGPSPGPSPPAPPAPPSPPTPPSPGTSHYEKPPCQSDEVAAQIQGLDGSVCAPKCNTAACPTDTPAGTKDTPSCCLQDSASGDKYCALECAIAGCPPGASCKHPSGSLLGICVYPSSGLETTAEFTYTPTQQEITV